MSEDKRKLDDEAIAEREEVARGKKEADPHPGMPSNPTLDRCRDDRKEMSPHETSECAGELLEEEYQNEEDGGS